jgi:hypothetical protein
MVILQDQTYVNVVVALQHQACIMVTVQGQADVIVTLQGKALCHGDIAVSDPLSR